MHSARAGGGLWRLALAGSLVVGGGMAVGCDRGGEGTTESSQSARAAAAPPVPAAETAPRSPRFGSGELRPKAEGTIRLASYNVENLFDDHDDPSLSGRQEDREMTKDAAHLAALAATIRELDADVLAMQEVESLEALLWFRDGHLADMGYEFVASVDAGDERGIEQSVLSRHPIVETKNWPRLPLGGTHPEKWGDDVNYNAGEPITFHRSPLMVTVEVQGDGEGGGEGEEEYRLTLLVVHQKSGRYGGYWREKEAAKTVELVRELERETPGRNIAVVGDFNARPDDAPARAFAEAGLVDVFGERVGREPAWVTHESGRVIDFVWANGALAPEVVPGSRTVFGTPARPEGADWRTTPPPVGYASDHYPLVVDLVPRDM